MAISFGFNRALDALVVAFTGEATWEDRWRWMQAAAAVSDGTLGRNLLVDFSGLSERTPRDDAVAFRALIRNRDDLCRNVRVALVASPEFPVAAMHGAALKENGVDVTEFETADAARLWLAAEEKADADAAAASRDEPIDLDGGHEIFM